MDLGNNASCLKNAMSVMVHMCQVNMFCLNNRHGEGAVSFLKRSLDGSEIQCCRE